MRMARSIRYALLLCFVLTHPAFAQGVGGSSHQLTSTKGAVLKNRAPVNKQVIEVRFPRPQETRLANGLAVMVLEDHRLPKVLLQVVIQHGSLSDPEDLPGLASFTADLLPEGAGTYSSLEIAEKLDGMGAEFYSWAEFGQNSTNAWLSGLSEFTDDIVALFADLLLRPTFPADELDKYRMRELASLAQLRVRPRFLAKERFYAALYPDHPAGIIVPTEEALGTVTRDDLSKFHDTYYLPNDAILAVTGDVTMEEIKPRLEAAFANWQPGEAPALETPPIKDAQARSILLVNRPNSVQTSLLLGNIGISRVDPDYPGVRVLNQVLGANSSSRLFMKLREEKGYTYGAYSSFRTPSYRGPWAARADVRTEVTGEALAEFINELTRMLETPVPEEELENARRAIVARFALSLERSQRLTGLALELKRFGLPADYWDRYPEKINSVTAEDVRRLAKEYLDPTRIQIVAVGDGDKIREVLARFGPIEDFSVDGTKVE